MAQTAESLYSPPAESPHPPPAERRYPSRDLRLPRDGWTVDDLVDVPEGYRYEIFDGGLFVSPMADLTHQRIADRIMIALDLAAPPGWKAIREIGVSIPGGYLGPDVAVLRPDAPMEELVTDPAMVALVVEVESRSSRGHDRFTKPPIYAEVGIESYWRVERTPDGPIVHLYRRSGSEGYELEHSVKSGETFVAELPYKVALEPGTWVS